MLTKSNAKDRWVGELSYPLYVSHTTAALIVAYFGVLNSISGMIVSIALAVGLVLLIDQPLENLRQSWIAANKAKKQAAQAALPDEIESKVTQEAAT
jgi:peptidoglycan/LPS O-acetylase OafA/YrhL